MTDVPVVTPYPATPTREGVGVDTTRFTFIGPLKLTFYGLFYDGAYKQRDRNYIGFTCFYNRKRVFKGLRKGILFKVYLFPETNTEFK